VIVSPTHVNNIYQYEEKTVLIRDGQSVTHVDRFQIRYWNAEYVLMLLSDYGFSVTKNMFVEFAGTGSQYFLMKKKENTEQIAVPWKCQGDGSSDNTKCKTKIENVKL